MMDPATARLALKMQLDDVEAILASLPKNSDIPRDISERVAFEALRDELVKKWNEVQGQVYAYGILREENSNRAAFRKLLNEEQQAERDHDMACRLAGVPVPQRSAPPKQAPADQDPLAVEKTTSSKKRPAEHDVASKQSSDSGGKTKIARLDTLEVKKMSPAPHVPPSLDTPSTNSGVCSSCLDIHPGSDMLQLSCRDDGDRETHAYCRDCLRRLFESSVTDSSHFPPRCCSKIIPLLSCIQFLPQELITRFKVRQEELRTPNRTYCSNASCSKWVPPTSIVAGVATCTACSQKTCTTCKSKQHEGLCPEDKDVKKLMNVAHQKRWQTCPNCKEMVELERGCYHITCRCRHEFCYLCVAKYVKGRKTCKCRAGDEHYLLDRPPLAENANGAAVVPPPAAQPVAPVPAPIPVPLPPPIAAQPALPIQHPFQAAPAFGTVPPGQFYSAPVYQPFYSAVPTLGPAPPQPFYAPPAPAAPPAPLPVPAPRPIQQQAPCNHEFERLYRSEGSDTSCDWCGREDRWVNWCEHCDLYVCWYCTKHRT